MRLYKTSEYAIRVLVFLAKQGERRLSVKRLHKELDIPYKYLGKLMGTLAGAELVEATRGKEGGYSISRPLAEIYLFEVLEVVEGLEDFKRCLLGLPNCSDDNPCPLHKFWGPHRDALREMFFQTSLADLVDQKVTNI